MNAFKNLVVVAALASVCYGVYNSIMLGPGGVAPAEVAPNSLSEPVAELDGGNETAPLRLGEPTLAGGHEINLDSPAAKGETDSFLDDSFDSPKGSSTPSDNSLATGEPTWSEPNGNPFDNGSSTGESGGNSTDPIDVVDGSSKGAMPDFAPLEPTSTDSGDAAISDSSAQNPEPSATTADALTSDFSAVQQEAEGLTASGKALDALKMLTPWYGDPRLSNEDQEKLAASLDELAAQVIYSSEHMLEPAYTTKHDDTLQQIAEAHEVPWQLLAKINGFVDEETFQPLDPGPLPSGETLKIVRGPFHGIIDLTRNELTLILDDGAEGLYAGRFAVIPGADKDKLADGQYQVRKKNDQPFYYPTNGGVIAPGAPENPYGSRLLDLGANISLHGAPSGQPAGNGSIGMSDKDAKDVFDILSVGSRVNILR